MSPVGAAYVVGAVLTVLASGYVVFRVAMLTGEDVHPTPWLGSELTIGMLVAIFAPGLMDRHRRVEQDRSSIPAFAWMAAGATLGAFAAVGVWGIPWFVPVIPGILALVLFLARVVGWVRRTKLLRRGQRAEGVFSRVVRPGQDAMSASFTAVGYSIALTGSDGAVHEVEGEAYFPTGSIPRVGERVLAWFDEDDPRRHVIRRVGRRGPSAE